LARSVKKLPSDRSRDSASDARQGTVRSDMSARGLDLRPDDATSDEPKPVEDARLNQSVAQAGEFGRAGVSGLAPIGVAEERIFQDEAPRSMDGRRGEHIPAESFDEAGYLRLNPDVRRAVELGRIKSGYSHYVLRGSAEDRPLPGIPREPRNVMLTSPPGAERADVSAKDAQGAIDTLIIAPNAGMMIVGWIDDASHPLRCIRVIGPDWRLVIDDSRYFRLRRSDAEKAVSGRGQYAFGFVGFLQFDRGGAASGSVMVELWREGGFWTALQCTPRIVQDVELRDITLAYLAGACFFGNACMESVVCLEQGVGAELVRFNQAITRRIVTTPYVERFGVQERSPRSTIMVCLYGRPEFFFVQSCLFTGSPGIDAYEFVYVCNSPEIAEVLLREARSANLIYGLASSIMILPANAGFGAANNAAAGIARSDRLLAVNPDVFPRDPEWARKHNELLDAAPPEQTRLFGVPLYYDNGSLMHGGIYFDIDVGLSLSSGRPIAQRVCRTEHYGKGAPAQSTQFTRPRPVPAVTGAFMSIDRQWFEQLGGFTEDFIFGHYEDADFCLKSLERGTAPWLQDIRMWHLEGSGSTRQLPHEGGSIVNRWLFSRTWLPLIESALRGPAPSHVLMRPPASAARSVAEVRDAKRKRDRSGGMAG
jgi:GT2 family glycosyltransferase